MYRSSSTAARRYSDRAVEPPDPCDRASRRPILLRSSQATEESFDRATYSEPSLSLLLRSRVYRPPPRMSWA